MKNIKRIFVVALLLIVAGTSFAQRGPGGTGDRDGHHGPKRPPCNVLAEPCLEILLGKLSADDAAALQAALRSQQALMDQTNQLRAAAKAAREAKDTAAFRAAMEQLKGLRRQGKEIGKTIREILHRNNTAVREALLACCEKPAGGGTDDGSNQHILRVSPIKPNPVLAGATSAEFTYGLKAEVIVSITINDQLGNLVKTVSSGTSAIGEHVVLLDLTGMTTGGYLVRIQAGSDVQSLRLIIQ
jgi:hypothetical protein